MPSAVYDGSTPSCEDSVASKRYLPLSSCGQFLGRFVAEGIADDDEGPAVLAPRPARAARCGRRTVLVRHLVDLPLASSSPSLRLDELAPGQGQRWSDTS